jgi:hypothetical protein
MKAALVSTSFLVLSACWDSGNRPGRTGNAATGGVAMAGAAGTGDSGGPGGGSGGTAGTGPACVGTGGTGAAAGGGAAAGAGVTGAGGGCALPSTFRWSSSGVLVSPMSDATHNLVSVKDPTVVFFDSRWHIYATTANTSGNWSMVYLNFLSWPEAATAPQYTIDRTAGLSGYHCAPQVFFFRPQNKWYLIYQSQQPQYSTADDLSRPETWTQPQNFFPTNPCSFPSLPIDYWIICDDVNCHLFFTGDNGLVYRSQTSIQNFPNGMSEPIVVMQDTRNNLFEGSSHYRIKGTDSYLTLVEAIGSGGRYYRSFVADGLDGPWTPLAATEANPFAGAANVTYPSGVTDWTNDVSHGELLRDGYDETLTVDACNLRFLYQGRDPAINADYSQLPYRLGLLTYTN